MDNLSQLIGIGILTTTVAIVYFVLPRLFGINVTKANSFILTKFSGRTVGTYFKSGGYTVIGAGASLLQI